MTRTINVNLNSSASVKQALKELKAYKKSLSRKCETVVTRLAEIGIQTAKLNCGEYGNVITFSREIMAKNDGGVKGRLVAVGNPVFRLRGGSIITMNPLLMAEFGSGFEANVLDSVSGISVGQGTFPDQTHANDPNGWWYVDIETGESHHSYGESPSHPMHNAMMEMIREVNSVLQEVFGNG